MLLSETNGVRVDKVLTSDKWAYVIKNKNDKPVQITLSTTRNNKKDIVLPEFCSMTMETVISYSHVTVRDAV